MPDATDTQVTVDGVEPSILVQYVGDGSNDPTHRIKIHPDDEGINRYLVLNDEPSLVTNKDLAAASGFNIKIIEPDTETVIEPAKTVEKAATPPAVISPNLPSTPPVQGS